MKLNKLKVVNMGNHESTEIEFGKVNVIIGGNGEGKSKLVDSLSFALGGTLPTRPPSEYVRTGQKEASAEVEVEVGKAKKSTRKVINEEGKVKTELMSTNALLGLIGTNPNTMRTLIDTRFFVEGADNDIRRNVLSSVLTPKLDEKGIIEAVKPHAEEKHIDAHMELIHNSIDKLDSPKKTQTEVLHKIAMDLRRDTKKDLKSIEGSIADVDSKLSVYKDTGVKVDSESVERTKKHAETSKEIEFNRKTLDKYKEEVASYEKKIAELKKSHAELSKELSSEVTEEQVAGIQKKISVIESQVRGIDQNITILNAIKPDTVLQCPYFEECRYDKVRDDIKDAIGNLTKVSTNKNEELSKLRITLEEDKTNCEASSKIAEIAKMIKMAEKKLDDMKKVEGEQEVKLSELNKKIEELEKAGVISSEGIAAAEGEEQMAKLKARKDIYEEDAKKKKAEITFLEEAVRIYSDKDIWTSLLSHNRDTFVTKLKEIVELLIPKYEVKIDDNMDITFSNVSINTLSASEKFRVGMGIQAALAISSKIGILVIDGSDIITDPTDFIECLNKLGVMPEIETMVIASSVDFTNSDESRAKSKLQVTAKLFRVVSGKVERCEDLFGTLSWG